MSSGDRLPVRNSLTGKKRERSPTPANSRSRPRDATPRPSSPVHATEQQVTGATAKKQNLQSSPQQDATPGSSSANPTTRQRAPGTIAEGQGEGGRTKLVRHLDVQQERTFLHPRSSTSLDKQISPTEATRPRASGNVPATKQRLLNITSEEQSQQLSPARNARAGPSRILAALDPSLCNRSAGEDRRREPLPGNRRAGISDTKKDSSPRTSSRKQSQPSRGLSADAEEHAQTRQMVKATKELRKLSKMFEAYSSSDVGSGENSPRSRQIRRRVQVQKDLVNEFEHELVYVSWAVWYNPQLSNDLRFMGPYNDEIDEILQTEPDIKKRSEIFQQMLHTLRQSSGSSGPGDDARRARVRQLELVLQDTAIELEESGLQKTSEAREQEVSSLRKYSNGSRIGSRVHAGRPPPRRKVIIVKPLQDDMI